MKRTVTAEARAYYEAQADIMQEMQEILSRRTAANSKQIIEQLEALQRRAYPQFYAKEPQQIQTKPEPISAEPEEQNEPQGLTFPQICIGLFYYFTAPIRRADQRRKAHE